MASGHCCSVCELNENWCKTEIQLHEAKYVWIIDNFDFHEALGIELLSPTFSAVTNNKIKWCMVVKPNGETDAKDTVSLYVRLCPGSMPKKIFAKYTASVLNSQQEGMCQTKCIANSGHVCNFDLDSADCPSWGRTKFLEKTADLRNTILANNKLTIICTITFAPTNDAFLISNTCHRCDALQLYPEVPACNIGEKLGIFLENHELADIVFCVKGKEYPAHKLILAAQSPVFAAMFKHNLKENETNRIEIADMNEDVVAEMLRYIYTGKCENLEKLAGGLLAAADKYDLGRLKMICAEALYKTMSVDNAANILDMSDLHGVTELKFKTIEFIVARFTEVLNTTAWKNLLVSHSDLINEVCQALTSRLTAPNVGILRETN